MRPGCGTVPRSGPPGQSGPGSPAPCRPPRQTPSAQQSPRCATLFAACRRSGPPESVSRPMHPPPRQLPGYGRRWRPYCPAPVRPAARVPAGRSGRYGAAARSVQCCFGRGSLPQSRGLWHPARSAGRPACCSALHRRYWSHRTWIFAPHPAGRLPLPARRRSRWPSGGLLPDRPAGCFAALSHRPAAYSPPRSAAPCSWL